MGSVVAGVREAFGEEAMASVTWGWPAIGLAALARPAAVELVRDLL